METRGVEVATGINPGERVTTLGLLLIEALSSTRITESLVVDVSCFTGASGGGGGLGVVTKNDDDVVVLHEGS